MLCIAAVMRRECRPLWVFAGYDGNGHVDLRHSVPDVLASTANLLKTNGWQAGAPFTAGTPNFEVAMREWNHSEIYRKTIVLMAQRISGG
jgi:membrane-bound lytic murein transglycosylase B